MYIYIYIERERASLWAGGEASRVGRPSPGSLGSVRYIYIYIYIYNVYI